MKGLVCLLLLTLVAGAAGPQSQRVARDGETMLLVPAGSFTMGSTDMKDEQPVGQVNVPAFYMARTAVTNDLYRKFVQASHYQSHGNWKMGIQYGDQAPVTAVTWDDARAYCKWAGMRLPTEAEWEKASRGKDGRRYPWGDAFNKLIIHTSVEHPAGWSKGPIAVGSHPENASPFGCLDMVGNVWEWTSSVYEPYPYVADKREDPHSRDPRTVRGASWVCNDPQKIRCANRVALSPDVVATTNGFRCAMSP